MRDDSIFKPESYDSVGELRELTAEVMEQDDATDTPGNLAASGAALLLIGAVVGAGGMWLVRVGRTVTNADLVGHDRRHPAQDGQHLTWLVYIGVLVSFVAAVFCVFALVSFAKIVAIKVRARDC